jgi:hypothetical protein
MFDNGWFFNTLTVLAVLAGIWLIGALIAVWIKGERWTEVAMAFTGEGPGSVQVRATVLFLLAVWPYIAIRSMSGWRLDAEATLDRLERERDVESN